MLTLALAVIVAQAPFDPVDMPPPLQLRASQPHFYGLNTPGDACTLTSPTGTKGEELTFARASVATCSKRGLWDTGIWPGDLVEVPSGQPRLEPHSDGILGIRMEPPRTNFLARSTQFHDTMWIKTSVTLTVSDGGSFYADPFGGNNATRLAWNGNTGSYIYQGCSTTGSVSTRTIYARAVPGAVDGGVLPWCVGGSAGACMTCPLPTDGTFTRCKFTTDAGATSSNSFVGCDSSTWGGAGCPGGEAMIYGAQCEVGASTSLIVTDSSTAARAVDSAKFAITPGPAATGGSMSVVTETVDAVSDTGWAALEGTTGWQVIGFGAGVTRFHATSFLTAAAGPLTGMAKRSVGGDATASFACTDTTCGTGAGITTTGVPTYFWLGDYNVGFPGTRTMNGIISRPCWAPDSTTKCK